MDTTHLFVLSGPYSGSTLLWELLRSSPAVSSLPGEGQSLCETVNIMRPLAWEENVQMPWEEIIPVWNSYWDPEKAIHLEKSPPLLMHCDDLVEQFSNVRFIALSCEPYAQCESLMRRSGWNAAEAIQFWCSIARRLRHVIECYKHSILHFLSYEALCSNPTHCCQRMIHFLPELEILDWRQDFLLHSVDGCVCQPIKNLNPDKRKRLSEYDKTTIMRVLSENQALIRYFDYSIDCPEDE